MRDQPEGHGYVSPLPVGVATDPCLVLIGEREVELTLVVAKRLASHACKNRVQHRHSVCCGERAITVERLQVSVSPHERGSPHGEDQVGRAEIPEVRQKASDAGIGKLLL